ncbi:MAG: alcohol dehydrogenase catalytic domain-containing protein, partial [Planctomycetota bacterium]|nr:alcohol dehydrogenase catalytic domain-containing protein [Planctomycetota bacterium]
MKAIQLQEPQKLSLIDVDEPTSPGAGQALVRTHCVGICGTDTSAYLGKFPLYIYPRIPGHELGVEVLEVGAEVTHIAAGDRCSVEPYMHCGDCHACRKGATN